MLAVKGSRAAAAGLLEGIATDAIAIANFNSPHQQVISGDHLALVAVEQRAKAKRLSGARLRVAGAFHSPLMKPAVEPWSRALCAAPLTSPRDKAVMSTIDAEFHELSASSVRAVLDQQLTSPVRFVESVERPYSEGARTFLEVGPGQALFRLIDDILEGKPHLCLSADPCGSDPTEHAAKVWRALSPADSTPKGLRISRPLQEEILAANQAVVERFFTEQQSLIRMISSWSAGEREPVAEEIIRANRRVTEAFLTAQSAAAGM